MRCPDGVALIRFGRRGDDAVCLDLVNARVVDMVTGGEEPPSAGR